MADDSTSEHNYIFDRDNKASVRYGCALSFDIQTDFLLSMKLELQPLAHYTT